MTAKRKSREVRAFVCGACRRLRTTRKQADRCCLCPCGAKVTQGYWRRCGACGLRNAIRVAKSDVKRARVILAAREARLASLAARTTEPAHDHPRTGHGHPH